MKRLGKAAAVVLGAIGFAAVLAGTATAVNPPQGTYRMTLSRHELGGAAAVGLLADNDLGTWTLTIGQGQWTLLQARGIYGNTADRGSLAVHGRAAAFTLTSGHGYHHHQFLGSARWQETADGIQFSPIGPPQVDVIFVLTIKPWRRVH